MRRGASWNSARKNKQIPWSVIVFAILFYLGAILCFLFGMAFIIMNALLGVALIITSGIFVLTGIGLLEIKRWAKISAISLSALGVLLFIYLAMTEYGLSLLSRSQYVVYALISGVIMAYFLFSKKVKKSFG